MNTELAVLELIIVSLDTATKGGAILQKARNEGRTVTQDELDTLVSENAAKRKAWDDGNK